MEKLLNDMLHASTKQESRRLGCVHEVMTGKGQADGMSHNQK